MSVRELENLSKKMTPEQRKLSDLIREIYMDIPESILKNHFNLVAGDTKEEKLLGVVTYYPITEIEKELLKMKLERDTEYVKAIEKLNVFNDCKITYTTGANEDIKIHIGKYQKNT